MDNKDITYETNWVLTPNEVYAALKDTHTKEEIDTIIKSFNGKPTKEILNKIIEFGKNAVITQSNELVEASQKLSAVELRIVYNLISTLDPQKEEDFTLKKVSIKDLAERCRFNPKEAYKQIKKACKSIMEKPIVLSTYDRNGKDITLIRPWFTQFDMFQSAGYLQFKFHPDLHDELLKFQELRRGFVSAEGEIVNELSDVYSMRLYFLMIKYYKIKTCEYSINKLITIFDLKGKYIEKRTGKLNTSKLIQKVIEGSIKKINDLTDLNVEYKPIKEERRIKSVKFFISKKDNSEKNNQHKLSLPTPKENIAWINNTEVKNIFNTLKKYGFSDMYKLTVVRNFNDENDFIMASKKAIKSLLEEKEPVFNPGGYLFQAILNYIPPEAENLNKEENKSVNEIINNVNAWDELLTEAIKYAKTEEDFIKILQKASVKRADIYQKYAEEVKNELNYEYNINDEVLNYRIEHADD